MNAIGQTNCPTCGTGLDGRSICPRCGTLVGAELTIKKAQIRARSFLDSKISQLPSVTPYHFLWACALMPLFIVPPLVALFFATFGIRHSTQQADRSANEWIAIIALINIVLSAIILYQFHFSPVQIIEWLAATLQGTIDGVFEFIRGKTVSPRAFKV